MNIERSGPSPKYIITGQYNKSIKTLMMAAVRGFKNHTIRLAAQ